MKRGTILAAFAAAALWCTGSSAATKAMRDPVFEKKIDAEIRARDPDTADRFAEATAAADNGELDRAASLFEQVRAAAPWFVHATRRLCGEVSSGRGASRASSASRKGTLLGPSSHTGKRANLSTSKAGLARRDPLGVARVLGQSASAPIKSVGSRALDTLGTSRGNPRLSRTRPTKAGSVTSPSTRSRPPQLAQQSTSTSKLRRSRVAQSMRGEAA